MDRAERRECRDALDEDTEQPPPRTTSPAQKAVADPPPVMNDPGP